jgi:hypothetical protein
MKFLKILILNLFLIFFSTTNPCLSQDYDLNAGLDMNIKVDFSVDLGMGFPPDFAKAVIVQMGNQNEAYQIQNGIANTAFIYQEGISNYAYQLQEGDHNEAYIIQRGSGNKAYQNQYNDYNTGIIVQIGNENEAHQNQYGYAKGIIIQNGNGHIITQN